jgi:threonylcarbamoyladenosine tRNA methylthiotransferase MtaB
MMNDELQQLDLMPALSLSTDNEGIPLKVAFWTLGCRLNQYDTEGMKVAMAGTYAIEVVPWSEQAHLYILNSCTVTSKADQECRRLARQAKRRNPGCKVVVAGCYAQTQPESLAKVEEIDGVVGNTNKEDVARWLPEIMGDSLTRVQVEDFEEHPVFDSPLIETFEGRSRAFVKIQDGCDLRCTYCLIWQARGPGRSRAVDNVLAQLGKLVDAGYNETILAGIHLGGYGRDLNPKVSFPDLLAIILQTYPQLRIRLSSIHPNEVTAQLLQMHTDNPNLRPHMHISLQSGSDGVLARMKRPYRSDRAWQAMADVAAAAPDFGIGADIIVGFPGETDAEFEDTRKMVADNPFSYLHVFRFSPRPGTPAATMDNQVHPELISSRSAILRELAKSKAVEFQRSLVGSHREAVVEAESKIPGWRQATTDNYVTVMVPDSFDPGQLVTFKIDHEKDGNLFAPSATIVPTGE